MSNVRLTCNYSSEVPTYVFTWRYVKFYDWLSNNEEDVKEYRTKKSSTDFRPQLKMLLLGSSKDIIQIYFLSPIQVRVSCELKVMMNNEEYKTLININENMVEAYTWNFMHQLHTRDLLNNTYEYFSDNGFLLLIKFKIFNDSSTNVANLNSDLETLLNKSLFSDVIIKSNGGKEYNVHRAILAGRSAVLRAHFEHDTVENHTNVVEAPFETEVMDEVLLFIYSDKVLRIEEIPTKILAAADFYQLNGLKNLCAMELRKQLGVENAIKTLELADLYREDSLKQATLGYIKNVAGGLTRLDSWEEALSVQLIKSIYLDKECSESCVELGEK